MKEYAGILLSLAAMTGGIVCLACCGIALCTAIGLASGFALIAGFGILLMAGGGAYTWIHGRR